MTLLTPQSRSSVRRMSREEVDLEIKEIETRRGSLAKLQAKAARDALTADERADMRRLDSLKFLLSER